MFSSYLAFTLIQVPTSSKEHKLLSLENNEMSQNVESILHSGVSMTFDCRTDSNAAAMYHRAWFSK